MPIDFDNARKAVAFSTSLSWKNVPHVSFIYEPDVSKAYDLFLQVKESIYNKQHISLSFTAFVLKLISEGIKAAPILNSSIAYSAFFQNGRLLTKSDIDISIPWLLKNGGTLPIVIKKVQDKSIQDLSVEIKSIKDKIKNTNIDELLFRVVIRDSIERIKHLDPLVIKRVISLILGKNTVDHLKGKERIEYYKASQTCRLNEEDIRSDAIIVSNIGSLNKQTRGTFTLLEIIPPQIVAFGISSIQEKPCVIENDAEEKAIGIRKVLPVCIVFDHRAIDFNAMIPLLTRLDDIFANPSEIVNW